MAKKAKTAEYVAHRTCTWSGGVVQKGDPVPSDIPAAYVKQWLRQGWIGPASGKPDLSPSELYGA